MSNSSIWAIDKTLSDATTPGQSMGNEEVHPIPESSMDGASPFRLFNALSSTLVAVGGGRAYSSAEMHSVYSAAAAKWTEDLKGHTYSKEI